MTAYSHLVGADLWNRQKLVKTGRLIPTGDIVVQRGAVGLSIWMPSREGKKLDVVDLTAELGKADEVSFHFRNYAKKT